MQRKDTLAREAWLAAREPNGGARLRLFCFPYAGLGASVFRSWVGSLGPDVDVLPIQLPGRETRQAEAPFRRLDSLADHVADALSSCLDVPFAFFGHSMGALIAFEVSRRLGHVGGLQRLFVSARRAPHLPDPLPPISQLPTPAFIDAVQIRYQGIPDAVVAEPELMDLLLPRLRADLEMLETYTCEPSQPLPCGVSVFGGLFDATVTRPELDAWQGQSAAGAAVRMLPSGHLFLQDQRAAILAAIASDLGIQTPRQVAAC
jgi:medium-chain acyl-[acyl-carrier-protein] hydrolase